MYRPEDTKSKQQKNHRTKKKQVRVQTNLRRGKEARQTKRVLSPRPCSTEWTFQSHFDIDHSYPQRPQTHSSGLSRRELPTNNTYYIPSNVRLPTLLRPEISTVQALKTWAYNSKPVSIKIVVCKHFQIMKTEDIITVKRLGLVEGKEQRPSLHVGVLAIEKGAFESPSTTVTNNNSYGLLIAFPSGSLDLWVECSPMVRETWVQYQVASYQRL